MKNFLHFGAAALAALLLASPLAHAQQSPDPAAATPAKTKIKTKRSKNSAPAASAPVPAPGAAAGPGVPPAPPVGGPRPPRPGGPSQPSPGGPGQPGPGGPGQPGPDGPGGPGKPGAGGPPAGRVQQLSDFSGTLTGYTAGGDDQLYDGFAFKTSTGTDTVRFPRHLAQALMAAAKAGSQVTVTGFRATNPEGRAALHLVSLAAAGQTVRDTPPTPPAAPVAEQATTVTGTVRSLGQDPQGRPNSLVMSDGTLLRLSPAAATQLADQLKAGATVAATGTLHTLRPGEVAARPVRVVQAEVITLNGKQFLVK